MNLDTSRRLAVGFAAFEAVGEVIRNWGDWGYWPFWAVDYLFVAMLLFGAWRTAKHPGRGQPILSGAWGFTCAVFYMSFFGHLEQMNQADHGPFDTHSLTAIIGIMFLVTIWGFAASLRAPQAAAP